MEMYARYALAAVAVVARCRRGTLFPDPGPIREGRWAAASPAPSVSPTPSVSARPAHADHRAAIGVVDPGVSRRPLRLPDQVPAVGQADFTRPETDPPGGADSSTAAAAMVPPRLVPWVRPADGSRSMHRAVENLNDLANVGRLSIASDLAAWKRLTIDGYEGRSWALVVSRSRPDRGDGRRRRAPISGRDRLARGLAPTADGPRCSSWRQWPSGLITAHAEGLVGEPQPRRRSVSPGTPRPRSWFAGLAEASSAGDVGPVASAVTARTIDATRCRPARLRPAGRAEATHCRTEPSIAAWWAAS